jgi:hypothetical protein
MLATTQRLQTRILTAATSQLSRVAPLALALSLVLPATLLSSATPALATHEIPPPIVKSVAGCTITAHTPTYHVQTPSYNPTITSVSYNTTVKCDKDRDIVVRQSAYWDRNWKFDTMLDCEACGASRNPPWGKTLRAGETLSSSGTSPFAPSEKRTEKYYHENTVEIFRPAATGELFGDLIVSVPLKSHSRRLSTPKTAYFSTDSTNDVTPEIILQDQSTGRIGVWVMDGYVVGEGLTLPTTPGPGWKVVGVADYNNDDTPDVLLQHQDSMRIGVWLMGNDGNVAQGLEVTNTPGPGWKVAGVADYNNDGQVDFVLQQQDTRQVAVWQMSGLHVAGGPVIANVPGPGWKVAGVADYNGDGQVDFVLQQQDTRQVAIWQMSGPNVAGGGLITSVPGPGWKVAGVGHYNNDGQVDLLLQQQDTRQVAIWQMSGLHVASGPVVTSTPAPGFKVVALN